MTAPRGIVYLVGAGPGDPGLITVAALEALRRAEVVVYDRLIDPRLLDAAPPDAERINAGKARGTQRMTQSQINGLLVDRARAGRWVVRLKGGDPFVFGRGFEELSACRDAGVDCVVIPGVSSAIAAPAAAGIPVTLRGLARSFAVVTAETGTEGGGFDFDAAAFTNIDTLVVLMGREGLARIARDLIAAGRSPTTPAACIERATTPHQRIVSGTLADIADTADRAGLVPPVVTVIGPVAALGERPASDSIDNRQSKIGNSFIEPTILNPMSHETTSPLTGKRILLTRTTSTSRELLHRLLAAGACPILCPTIKIVYPRENAALDRAIGRLTDYHWIVFTSVHAVKAFSRRLAALEFDARRLAGCKIAAIGPTTARALRRRGLRADLIPADSAGESLASALIAGQSVASATILFPRGDRARSAVPEALRAAGATVDDPVAYVTADAAPSAHCLARIREGVDAVLFCSPSAVRRFVELKLDDGGAPLVCIGATTASAAREAGLSVAAVAAEPSTEGLIDALSCCFTAEVNA